MFYRKTPRKTRIKVIERGNGDIEYVAQYKSWGMWCDFDDIIIYSVFREDAFYPYLTKHKSMGLVQSINLDKVKHLIDDYIKLVEEAVQKKEGDKVVKTGYMDYP